MAQYYHCACIHATSGFLDLFHCLWASFAHFFLLGHPRPISFPWASSVHSNYTFTWAFANYFGLLWPNFHILYFWGSWAIYQPLTYFITSGLLWPILTFHTVHEFITSFFGLLFLLSLRPIYYFLGLWSIIPVIRVLWFSSQFTNSFPLILLGFFLLLGLFVKVSINTLQLEGQARQRP